MSSVAPQGTKAKPASSPWRGFRSGLWQKQVDVRDFIQQNYEPYEGDQAFLAPATPRTRKIWGKLNELFVEERKKGVLDISQIPSSINAHAPVERVDVLPFHQMGRFKWKELGLEYTLDKVEPPSSEALEQACASLRAAGLKAY